MDRVDGTSVWRDERGEVHGASEKGRGFPGLDGLRGIAAIVVVAYHFRSASLGYDRNLAGEGYLAVDLFFALSGFVLSHAYLNRFSTGMTIRSFLIVRAIRLYPLMHSGCYLASSPAWRRGHFIPMERYPQPP